MSQAENILVCVTQQKTCERLILKAAELRDGFKSELFVIHVAKNEWLFLDSKKESEALEYLYNVSKSVGASMTVQKSDEIVRTIADFSKENRIRHIVMGESPGDHKENIFSRELKKMLNNVEIHVVAPT